MLVCKGKTKNKKSNLKVKNMTDQDPTSNDQTDLFNAGPVVETLNTELAAPVLGSVAIEGTEKVDELPAAETELSIETEA